MMDCVAKALLKVTQMTAAPSKLLFHKQKSKMKQKKNKIKTKDPIELSSE